MVRGGLETRCHERASKQGFANYQIRSHFGSRAQTLLLWQNMKQSLSFKLLLLVHVCVYAKQLRRSSGGVVICAFMEPDVEELPLSSPDELPLDPEGLRLGVDGSQPAEQPTAEQLVDLGLLPVPTVRLRPPTPCRGGRGRGRGRPHRSRPALLATGLGQESPSLAPSAVAVAAASDLAFAVQRPQLNARFWFGEVVRHDVAERRATIPHGGFKFGQPQSSNGFTSPLQNTGAVVAALVAARASSSQSLDNDVTRLVNFYLEEQVAVALPMTAMSMITRVDRKRLLPLTFRAATAMFMLQRAVVSTFEDLVCQGLRRDDLVHYVEAVQYDETPMPTRLLGDPKQAPGHAAAGLRLVRRGSIAPPAHVLAVPATGICSIRSRGALKITTGGTKQKIMQTRSEVGMVLKVGNRFCTMVFHASCPLAVLEDTTAKCITQQQLSISRCGRAALCFKGITRATTTDGHPSNILAESTIAGLRSGDRQPGVHVLCSVHRTALVYDKTMALVDDDVSGLIRVALALRTGSAMMRFRACLRQEIASRLDVLHGSPPRSAMEYRRKLLRMFCTNGANIVTKRVLLTLLPNGDWRSRKVQFWVRHDTPRHLTSVESVLDHLTNGLTLALASAQPPVYNRSKWTGSDIAVDYLGIFEGCHRLLSTSYARFCATFEKGAVATQLLNLAESLQVYGEPPLAAIPAAYGQAAQEAEPHAAGEEGGGANVLPGVTSNTTAEAARKAAAAAVNAKTRRLGLAWIVQNRFGHVVMIRLLMEPLRQYLAKQFRRAADAWDYSEKAKQASACLSSGDCRRSFRIVSEAEGVEDECFLQSVRWLFQECEMWDTMPPRDHHASMRSLAFRCASRMGCVFHKLLRSRHKGFPYQMFRLLTNPDFAEKFRNMSECVLDEWCKSLRRRYPTLTGDEFFQVLYTVAVLLRVDVSHVEARHASIRRFLTAGSVQTHQVSLPTLSAQWLFQQFRTSRNHSGSHRVGKASRAAQRRQQRTSELKRVKKLRFSKAGKPEQRAGYGGAWRAWVRMKANGRTPGRLNFTQLSAEYKAAKEANTAEFQEAQRVGAAATSLGNATGRHGFGGNAPKLRKAQRLLAETQHLLRLSSEHDPAKRTMALVTHSLASGSTLAQVVAAARAGQRLASRQATQLQTQQDLALAKFEETTGAAIVEAVKASYPALAAQPMIAEPTHLGYHVRVEAARFPEDLAATVDWANQHSHTSGLAKSLEEQWLALHHTITSDNNQQEPVEKPQDESKCRAAGVCLCSESGKLVERRAKKFVNEIRLLCRTRLAFKKWLAQGRMIVKLVGTPKKYEDFFAEDGSGMAEVWLHIGHMIFSPTEPCFMEVEPTEALPEPATHSADRLYVRSKVDFVLLYEVFARFEKSEIISSQWFCLEEGTWPIVELLPQTVSIFPLSGYSQGSLTFWPRRPTARSRQPPPGDAGGGEEDEDGAADGGGDGGEEATDGEDLGPDEDPDEEPEPEFLGLLDPLLEAYDEPLQFPVVGDPVEPSGSATPVLGGTAMPALGGNATPVHRGTATPVAAPIAPAPPEPAAEPPRKKTRGPVHEHVLQLEAGTITYYASNNTFEARCRKHFAERCTLTRKAYNPELAASSRDAAVTGRPLALLACWLEVQCQCEDKEEHKDEGNISRLAGPECHADRQAVRRELAAIDGAAFFFSKEAPMGDDPLAEPHIVR